MFEGLPTFAGGYDVEANKGNLEVYQYHWDRNEWEHREDLRLKHERSRGAMFEVPRDLYGICWLLSLRQRRSKIDSTSCEADN